MSGRKRDQSLVLPPTPPLGRELGASPQTPRAFYKKLDQKFLIEITSLFRSKKTITVLY